MNLIFIIFLVVSSVTVASAALVVYSRNPIVSALYLALAFLGISGLFVLLEAQFLALVQVLIYSGAIVILFIYVIMLLELSPEKLEGVYGLLLKTLGAVISVAMLLVFFVNTVGFERKKFPPLDNEYAKTENLARALFTNYAVPFELVSLVLVIGIIGGVLLVKKTEKEERT